MNSDRIAEIIRDSTVTLRDRNMDIVDAVITPSRLIDALSNAFTVEQDIAHITLQHRGPKEDCGWPVCREPFDRSNFGRIANGGVKL